MMADDELENVDPDDISDLLVKVEKSFDMKFESTELMHIITFGELCDHIANKIQLAHLNDCTSQQAFYKLRDAMASILQIDYKTIMTSSALLALLPKQSRRSLVKKLEVHLGFKLHILRPPYWASVTLAILLVTSCAALFFNWQIGLAGLAFSNAGLWLAKKFGNILNLQTVGQLAKKMTSESYFKSRRNSSTFNKSEIEKILVDLFSNDLGIDKSKLTREAKLS
ncbi:hypothetical protein [Sphingobacterium sp. BIGb0165]|uniref:hypothetical protein n=1 Tax=Sphingobacterium sp. BIGb0165 TaxID=2940615 RepID=UPI002168162F|nr:hypothetical protein [Sphingobacterium sp. BIGb0165]MCS4226924.1 hypothetical protein [Sphingobacterium sp. BIGb0165]